MKNKLYLIPLVIFLALNIKGLTQTQFEITAYSLTIKDGSIYDFSEPQSGSKSFMDVYDFIKTLRVGHRDHDLQGPFIGYTNIYISTDTIIDSGDLHLDSIYYGNHFNNALNFAFGKTNQVRCDEFPETGSYYIIDQFYLESTSSNWTFEDKRITQVHMIKNKELPRLTGLYEPFSLEVTPGETINGEFIIHNSDGLEYSSLLWEFSLEGQGYSYTLKSEELLYPEFEEGEYLFETNFPFIFPGETKKIFNYPILIPDNVPPGLYQLSATPVNLFNAEDHECIFVEGHVITVLGPKLSVQEDTLKIYAAPNSFGNVRFEIGNIGSGILNWELLEDCLYIEPLVSSGAIGSNQSQEVEMNIEVPSTETTCSIEIHSNDAHNSPKELIIQFILTSNDSNINLEISNDLLCEENQLKVTHFLPQNVPFSSNNTFFYELSDESGNFQNALALKSLNGTGNKTTEIDLPADTDLNKEFYLRVRSTNAAMLGNPARIEKRVVENFDTLQFCTTYQYEDLLIETDTVYTDTLHYGLVCDSLLYIKFEKINEEVSIVLNEYTLTANIPSGAAVQWLDCDNNFSLVDGQSSSVFEVEENGTYTAEIVQGACVDTMECIQVMRTNITSTIRGEIDVYPNPFSSEVNIDAKEHEIKKIEFLSINGEQIKVIFSDQKKIDLSEHPVGVYILKVFTKNTITVHKLLKL